MKVLTMTSKEGQTWYHIYVWGWHLILSKWGVKCRKGYSPTPIVSEPRVIDWSRRLCYAHTLRDCWVCHPELNPHGKKKA
jgi:hypothetical protein